VLTRLSGFATLSFPLADLISFFKDDGAAAECETSEEGEERGPLTPGGIQADKAGMK
jgi:hypothetical protein